MGKSVTRDFPVTEDIFLCVMIDLFFHDYSIAPLFVQENYIHVKPVAAGWVFRASEGLELVPSQHCEGQISGREGCGVWTVV